MRHTTPLLFTCAIFLLPGCPGGGDTAETADSGGRVDPTVLVPLADRLAVVQNDDGSYDWERGVDEALTPDETGYQNVTGVAAMGFFGALRYASDIDWLGAMDRSADYFDDRLDLLVADPTNLDNALASANWTYLAWYQDERPDADLDAESFSGLNALLDARDATWGDDDSQRVDGLLNYLVDRRSYIPGIIPWDVAMWVEALDAMAARSTDFQTDADDAAAWLATYTADTFLPAYDADPSWAYADISLSMPLYVLSAHDGVDPDLRSGLQTRLEAIVGTDGEISNGSDDDGPVQASAYGLLALKRVGSGSAGIVQDYGEAQITAEGMVIDDERAVENYEVEGELLRALAE